PVCHNITDVGTIKNESINRTGKLKQRLLAVIFDDNGKKYRLPNKNEIVVGEGIGEKLKDEFLPQEKMQKISDLVSGRGWGIAYWKDMFSDRQLLAMQTFLEELHEINDQLGPILSDYDEAVMTFLVIFINRLTIINTSSGRWVPGRVT